MGKKKLTWKEKWRKREAENRRAGVYYVLFFVGLLLFVLFVLPLRANYDFYEYHVWQCEQAHSEGKAFNLVTGKTVDPPFGAESSSIVYPHEDPRVKVPHGCVGEDYGILAFGFYGVWTANMTITQYNVGNLTDTVKLGD